jgi:hypothetical protein
VTPAEWLEREQHKAELMAEVGVLAILHADQGHILLLAMADGLRALQAHCLATTRPVLFTSDTEQG